jgi:predicted lipoprotein with Yx(FWY)xxD motif
MSSMLVGAFAVSLGAGADTSRIAAQTSSTVLIAQSDTLGAILTAANGMTLYVFDGDNPNASNCDAGCVETWPPLLLAAGDPIAPMGLSGTLRAVTRGDGRLQVVYEGRPLYFFVGDTQVGDVTGDGVGGVWHVARPAAAAPPPATAAPPPATQPTPMPPTREPYEPGGMY